jgi:hypothetical protein
MVKMIRWFRAVYCQVSANTSMSHFPLRPLTSAKSFSQLTRVTGVGTAADMNQMVIMEEGIEYSSSSSQLHEKRVY